MPIEVTCRCGESFETYPCLIAQGRGKFCSLKCRDDAKRERALRTKNDTYLFSRKPHVLQPPGGVTTEQRLVLYAKIGPGPHPCHWCRTPVNWKPGKRTATGALVVDHLNDNKKNNDPANLVPSCHRCNCSRGRIDLVADDEPYVLMKGRNGEYTRHRAAIRTCENCSKPFKWLAADKRKSRGKYCSRKCLYAKHSAK